MGTLGQLLIVDDNVELLDLICESFRGIGYAVERAETGRDAIVRYAARRPDVVLLDLRLPDLPGEAALLRMRQLDATVRIIVVSANQDLGIAKDLLRRGAFDYAPKPCSLDYLERSIAAALGVRTPARRPA